MLQESYFKVKRMISKRFSTMHIFFAICFTKMVLGDLVIQTSSGPIQGVTTPSGDVESFLGVPYAEPPIGNLRFAKPVPKKPWTKILSASKLSPPCAQVSVHTEYYFSIDVTNMSEDCLYLNIWAPKSISYKKLKPVIVFIHPGGFIVGSASMRVFNGTNFARRNNIIVVTINYRLGPFGYFLAYIEEAAGNMGMYDQVMALKWVKNNARYFGGDPENIVLMGVSAGATSVIAHIVSPISESLFQKAIVQSGGIVLNFFFDNNTRLLKNSEAVASMTGCTNETTSFKNDPYSVVSCLKRQSLESILKAEAVLMQLTPIIFYPTTGDEFLPQPGVDLLRKGKFKKDVPILIGINSDEGTMFLSIGMSEYFGVYGHNIPQRVGKSRATALARSILMLAEIANRSEIENYYINNVKNKSSQGYTKMVANILGDYAVACNTMFPAEFISLGGNSVFFYVFGFRSPSTPMAEWIGVTHLDELQYIFGNPYHKMFTNEEMELSHRLMDRWSTFAKTGDPNIPGEMYWPRYSYQNSLYLNIEQEEESIRMNPNKRCEIWRTSFKSVIDADLIEYYKHLD